MLEGTVDIKKLSLVDWINIARARDQNNPEIWGFYGWLENTDADLNGMTRNQADAIGDLIGKNASYVWRGIERVVA